MANKTQFGPFGVHFDPLAVDFYFMGVNFGPTLVDFGLSGSLLGIGNCFSPLGVNFEIRESILRLIFDLLESSLGLLDLMLRQCK